MKLSGQVRKMKVEPEAPIQYFLDLNKESHSLNSFIGSNLNIKWEGIITCVDCGKETDPNKYKKQVDKDEFYISGLCRKCQKLYFPPEPKE